MRRGKIVGATLLAVMGVVLITTNFIGGSNLQAAGVGTPDFDLGKVLVWAGVAVLVISAFLFISASAE